MISFGVGSMMWALCYAVACGAAPACPSGCWCGERFEPRWRATMRVVDCADRRLQHVDTLALPVDTQVLRLDGNRIARLVLPDLPDLLAVNASRNLLTELPTGAFESTNNVRLLDLSDNQLVTVPVAAFDGLYELRELRLGRNKIAALHTDAFHGLEMLETLQLQDNPLDHFDGGGLRGLSRLRSLDLRGCRLSALPAKAFHRASQLQVIDLSDNRLSSVDARAFIGLAGLQYLYLANNRLPATPQRALGSVGRSLKLLDLSGNQLQRVDTDDIAAMPQLAELRLARMPKLQLVEMAAFTRLPQLVMVQLHDNPRLAFVDSSAFVDAPAVRHLYLHNNNLTTVAHQLLVDSLPNLEHVSLYGNPLVCDCNLRWLRAFLKTPKHAKTVAESSRLTCGSGAHHMQLMMALDESDFGSECAPRIIAGLLQPTVSAPAGTAVRFDCRAVGVPTPKIVWVSPDGRPVQPQVYHPHRSLTNGRTLSVHSLSSADSGAYTCLAESALGSAIAYSRLRVDDARVRLAVLAAAAQSIAVTWRSANVPADSQHLYQLIYRRAGSRMHHYVATVTPSMHSFTVTGLEPDTKYEVCLAVENADRVVTHVRCVGSRTKPMPAAVGSGLERPAARLGFSTPVPFVASVSLGVLAFAGACGLILSCVLMGGRPVVGESAVAPVVEELADDSDDSDTVSRLTWLPEEHPPPCTVVKSAAFCRLTWPPVLAGARTPSPEQV